MKVNTRIFGEVEFEDSKIIHFEKGIIGFPELQDFALVHDEQEGVGDSIKWLQSIQEPNFALPVMDPLLVKSDYNPQVEGDLLDSLGGVTSDDMLVLVTVTVPSDIKQMRVNLRAPIVINAANKQACQIIGDGDEYPVKFFIYDILKAVKAGE